MPYKDKVSKSDHNKEYYRTHKLESFKRVWKFRGKECNSPISSPLGVISNRPEENGNSPVTDRVTELTYEDYED